MDVHECGVRVAVRATTGVRVASRGTVDAPDVREVVADMALGVGVARGNTFDVVRTDTLRASLAVPRAVVRAPDSTRTLVAVSRSRAPVDFVVPVARVVVVFLRPVDIFADEARRTAARAVSVPSSAIAP